MPESGALDGRPTQDASDPPEAAVPAMFVCGTSATCDSATQFCEISSGGSGTSYACEPLPAACLASPACACVVPADAGAMTHCSEAGGEITVALGCGGCA